MRKKRVSGDHRSLSGIGDYIKRKGFKEVKVGLEEGVVGRMIEDRVDHVMLITTLVGEV